jgi:hypothetical protein
MFPWDLVEKVIEQQGIVAGLLLIMIIQQWGMQNKLLGKICTLETFIMDCLKNELAHESPGIEKK